MWFQQQNARRSGPALLAASVSSALLCSIGASSAGFRAW
jgi:hypothetical protein